jgi:putative glutamine amidotransferase
VPDHPFAIGVLWHPEADEDGRLFEALIAAARPAGAPDAVTTGR